MSTEPSLKQAKHTLEIIAQQDLDWDDMLSLHDGYLSDLLEGIQISRLSGCLPGRGELRVLFGLLPQHPTLTVNYDLAIEKMVDAGNYTVVWDNGCPGNISEYKRFRKIGKGIKKINIRLECIEKSVNLDENEAEKRVGKNFRLASYEEIFAFGATFPKVQCRCEYGIFGKSYNIPDSRGFPDRFHPHLWGKSRGLGLTAGGTYANPGTHFLFVER